MARTTREQQIRARGLNQLRRQRVRESETLSPEQIENLRRKELERLQKEAIAKAKEERNKEFDRQIKELESKLKPAIEELRKYQKQGRKNVGLSQKVDSLGLRINQLKHLQGQGYSPEQASQIAQRVVSQSEIVSAQQRGISQTKKELRVIGIDVNKLQEGTLKIEDLSPKQLDALTQKGLVKTTGVSFAGTTETERALGMSLPPDLRNEPVGNVIARQSLVPFSLASPSDLQIQSLPKKKSRVRSVLEKTPFVRDIVESKDVIDEKARKANQLIRNLERKDLTKTEINQIVKDYSRLGGKVKTTKNEVGETVYEFYAPTVKIGSIKETEREVPVAQLSNQGLFRYSTNILTGELGALYTDIAKASGLTEEGIIQYKRDASTRTITKERYGTIQYDSLSSKNSPFFVQEEVKIPEKTYKIGTPSQIGKTVQLGTDLALFTPRYAGGLAESTVVGSEFGGASSPTSYIKKYPVETAVIGTVGAYAGISKGVKWFKTPIIKTEKLIPKEKPFVDLGLLSRPTKRIIRKGKVIDYFKGISPNIRTVKPGRKTVLTNKGREFFGLKPLTRKQGIKVLRKNYGYETAEAKAISNLKSSLTKEKFVKKLEKEGISRARASELFTQEARIRETLRLRRPKVQQTKFAGDVKVTYREDKVPLIEIKGQTKTQNVLGEIKGVSYLKNKPRGSFVESTGVPITQGEKEATRFLETRTNFLRTKEGYPFTKISKAGKTTETYESIITTKELGDFTKTKLFKQAGVSKRIIPKSSKKGVIDTNILVSKGKPQFTITDESILESKGFNLGGRKKSSSQFLEKLYGSNFYAAQGTSSITKTPKSSKILKTPKTTSLKSSKAKKSIWAGTGLYERTTGGIAPFSLRKTDLAPQKLSYFSENALISNQEVKPLIDYKSQTKQSSKSLLKLSQKSRTLLKLGVSQPQRTKITQKQSQKLAQRLKTKLGLFFSSKPKLKTTLKTTEQKTPSTKIPIRTVIASKGNTVFRNRKGRIKKIGKTYFVYVRKFGVDTLIGKRTSLESAKKLLKEQLETTLRASGFIKFGSKKKKVDFGSAFRPSKKDPFRIVQKRGKRLSRKPEVKEIQFFKKRKGKKKNVFGI